MRNILIAAIALSMLSGCEYFDGALPPIRTVDGGALYLHRPSINSTSHKAEFEFAQDCRLIAEIMSKAEPEVQWYCK